MSQDNRALRPISDIELEQMLAKQHLDRGMFHRLLPLLGPVRRQIGLVVVLEALLVTAIFVRPWFIAQVIDHGVKQEGAVWSADWHLIAWM